MTFTGSTPEEFEAYVEGVVADVKGRLVELAWPEGNYADALDAIILLESEVERWKAACGKWLEKWNRLECDWCGTPMNLGEEI